MNSFFKISLIVLFIISPYIEAKNSKTKNCSSSNRDSKTKDCFFSDRNSKIKDLNFLQKDTNYYIAPNTENIDIIYSTHFEDLIPLFSDYTKKIDFELSKAFPSTPHFKKNSLFFSSSRYQISNAYATIYPNTLVNIFPSNAVHFIDQLSIFRWLEDVAIHEMTHIYQLSQNTKWDRKLWWFLSAGAFRNFILNSWILEGSAVFNESLYGFGGRLFSGWARALLFSQIKQDISLKRILKSYNDSFSGLEKYIHGGYFFAYLHSQYNIKHINQLFAKSSKYFPIDYYGLNSALKRTFGKDLETLFKNYKEYYAPIAKKQKSSTEKAILKSSFHSLLNSNSKKIYFLISDLKSTPELILFDKQTKKISRIKTDLPLGKVFHQNNKYYSATNEQTSSTSIEYSLFDENYKPLKKYNSQYVMDFYKDNFISLDSKQNHTQNSLLLNNAFYDTTHSSAVMDHQGRIYYFKQNKDTRTLYRNKKPLFSFKSYYAFPVEADETGLYFIGSVKYGSSLFMYKKGKVFRISPSDTISYARKINKNEFLISEITPTHYEYKIIRTQKILEKPFLYKYSFKKINIFDSLNSSNNRKEKSVKGKYNKKQSSGNSVRRQKNKNGEGKNNFLVQNPYSHNKKIKKDLITKNIYSKANSSHSTTQNQFLPRKAYNAITNLSLQRALLFLFYKGQYSYFIFSDPIQFNSLELSNILSPSQTYIRLSYNYKKYRPTLSLSFNYLERLLDRENDKYSIQTLKDLGFLEKKDIFIRNPAPQKPIKKNSEKETAHSDQNPPAKTDNLNQNQISKTLIKRRFIFYRDRRIDLSWTYPFLIKAYWTLSWKSGIQIGQKQFNNPYKLFPFFFYQSKPWKSYIQNTGELTYNFKRKYPLAYAPHHQQFLQMSYSMLRVKNKNQVHNILSGQIQTHWTKEIGKELFVSLNGRVEKNLWDKNPQMPLIKNEFGFISYHSFQRAVQDLYRLDLQILKVLNNSYYPLKLPFSIRRWAPLTGLSFLSFKSNHKKYQNFLIPFFGAEWDISLIAERSFFKFGFSAEYIISLLNPQKQYPFHLKLWIQEFKKLKSWPQKYPFQFGIWLKGAF